MNSTQTRRLADIRAQVEKLIAIEPAAENWDSAFLLTIIDHKNQIIKIKDEHIRSLQEWAVKALEEMKP